MFVYLVFYTGRVLGVQTEKGVWQVCNKKN